MDIRALKVPAVAALVVLVVGAIIEMVWRGAGALAGSACATGLVVWWTRQLHGRAAHESRMVAAHAQDAAAMPLLMSLLPADVPHSSFSLCPAALLRILNDIAFQEHQTIVECGAGVSTLLFGAKFRQLGAGHVWSIEHDPRWAAYMRRLIERHDLGEWITLVEAHLVESRIAGRDISWYDASALGRVLSLPKIDVLLVDGPPMGSGRLNRFGALPTFRQQLSERSLVVLDDAYRPGERSVARAWRQLGGLSMSLWRTSRGQYEFRIQP